MSETDRHRFFVGFDDFTNKCVEHLQRGPNSLSSLDVYSSIESFVGVCCSFGTRTSSCRMRRVLSWRRWSGSFSGLRIGTVGGLRNALARGFVCVPSMLEIGHVTCHESAMLAATGGGKSCTVLLIT